MENTRKIRTKVNLVNFSFIIISFILFMIFRSSINKIIGADSNENNVKLSFWGFVLVIFCREIIISVCVTVFLIIESKMLSLFSEEANYVGTILQVFCSLIWIIITMVKKIRPSNWFLCIVGFLFAIIIVVLFCILNFMYTYSNVKYMYLAYSSSRLLEIYYREKVNLAKKYNPVVEEYNKMNADIQRIGRELGKEHTCMYVLKIETENYPTCDTCYIGLFSSDFTEIKYYTNAVEKYGKKVESQSKKSEKQIEYLKIIINDKMPLVNECNKTMELANNPYISTNAKKQILRAVNFPFESLTKKVKLENKLKEVL